MIVKNAWYIACQSAALKKAPIKRIILNTPIVLFRTTTNRAQAVYDRCCHRGVPLSKGYVQDGCIVCPYHGWSYDQTGTCVHIPEIEALNQKIPKRAKVASFPTEEKNGFIWVYLGDTKYLEEHQIPKFGLFEDKWASVYNSVENVECNWLHMVENILDGAHLPFVHEGSLDNGNRWTFNWSRKFRRKKEKDSPNDLNIEQTEDGFVAFTESVEKKKNKEYKLAFSFRVQLPSTIAIELDFGSKKVRVFAHITPIDENKCYIEHIFTRNFLTSSIFDFIFKKSARKFLMEDVRVVEYLQPTYLRDGNRWEISTIRDKISLHLRTSIKKILLNQEANLLHEEKVPQEVPEETLTV